MAIPGKPLHLVENCHISAVTNISNSFFQQWQLQVQFVCTRPFCCELSCKVFAVGGGFCCCFCCMCVCGGGRGAWAEVGGRGACVRKRERERGADFCLKR